MPQVSPFTSYANAKLTFDLGNGQFSIDPESLNPVEGKTQTIVKAILTPGGAVPKEYQGTNEAWEAMKGYLVDPSSLPAAFAYGVVAKAEITTAPGIVSKGTFRLLPITNDPYVIGAGITIITEIKGLFRRQR